MYKFEKVYSRDTTYIMQELWAYGCSKGIQSEYGWQNPYLPGIIHRMNQGSIEIWENITATQWLMDTILKTNQEKPDFIDTVLEKYKEKLSAIHEIWKQGVVPINEMQTLIAVSRDALGYFIPYYYSAVDDRTSPAIRAKALEMRNKDEFFAENDSVIRNSLINIFPQVRGYETTLFIEDLTDVPDLGILRLRRESSFLIQGEKKFVGTMEDFNRNYPDFVFQTDETSHVDVREVKGVIAHKGKVTGTVKILRRRDQISEVTTEDIIVSPMTTPDFLPAMKIAKGFVTDEGGITCHAAIVSRELRKPCVIGTKVATQIFKDGDLVEVDAEKGIVRKI